MEEDPAPAKIDEVLHHLERLLDHHLRAVEEMDDQMELLLGLAVAVLGGGAVLLPGEVLATGWPPGSGLWPAAILLLSGAALAAASALVLLHGYVGLTRTSAPRVPAGPRADWLVAMALDPSWDREHLRYGLLGGFRDALEQVDGELRRKAGLRRSAIYALLGAPATYLAAILMVSAV